MAQKNYFTRSSIGVQMPSSSGVFFANAVWSGCLVVKFDASLLTAPLRLAIR